MTAALIYPTVLRAGKHAVRGRGLIDTGATICVTSSAFIRGLGHLPSRRLSMQGTRKPARIVRLEVWVDQPGFTPAFVEVAISDGVMQRVRDDRDILIGRNYLASQRAAVLVGADGSDQAVIARDGASGHAPVKIGCFGGYETYMVNGTAIRDSAEIDFTMGGNPYRYPKLVPDGQVWIDKDLDIRDVEATILHEVVESDLMAGSVSYNKAHEIANVYETRYRRGLFKTPDTAIAQWRRDLAAQLKNAT